MCERRAVGTGPPPTPSRAVSTMPSFSDSAPATAITLGVNAARRPILRKPMRVSLFWRGMTTPVRRAGAEGTASQSASGTVFAPSSVRMSSSAPSTRRAGSRQPMRQPILPPSVARWRIVVAPTRREASVSSGQPSAITGEAMISDSVTFAPMVTVVSVVTIPDRPPRPEISMSADGRALPSDHSACKAVEPADSRACGPASASIARA